MTPNTKPALNGADNPIDIGAAAQHAQDNAALREIGGSGLITKFHDLGQRDRDQYRRDMAAIISALDAAGWAIVPKMPTEKMMAAGDKHIDRAESAWPIYEDMIEAGAVRP